MIKNDKSRQLNFVKEPHVIIIKKVQGNGTITISKRDLKALDVNNYEEVFIVVQKGVSQPLISRKDEIFKLIEQIELEHQNPKLTYIKAERIESKNISNCILGFNNIHLNHYLEEHTKTINNQFYVRLKVKLIDWFDKIYEVTEVLPYPSSMESDNY